MLVHTIVWLPMTLLLVDSRQTPLLQISPYKVSYFVLSAAATSLHICSAPSPAIPVINAVAGTTIIGVQGRRLSLRFTISNALPEVTADNIQWFFESTNASQMELRPDSRHTFSPDMLSLTINPLVLSDEGNYTLRVSHITGTVTSTVFLEMQGLCASHVWKYSCCNPICLHLVVRYLTNLLPNNCFIHHDVSPHLFA